MPQPLESVVDEDVSGDGSHGGMTFAFDDDDLMEATSFFPPENEQQRLSYIEDIFEGSGDRVTSWKSVPSSVHKIEVNGAENRLLHSMKSIIQPVMTASYRLILKPTGSIIPADFAGIYANRDWYLMLLDYVNARIEDPNQHTTPLEIFEMHRVWMLQSIYGTTAKNYSTMVRNGLLRLDA